MRTACSIGNSVSARRTRSATISGVVATSRPTICRATITEIAAMFSSRIDGANAAAALSCVVNFSISANDSLTRAWHDSMPSRSPSAKPDAYPSAINRERSSAAAAGEGCARCRTRPANGARAKIGQRPCRGADDRRRGRAAHGGVTRSLKRRGHPTLRRRRSRRRPRACESWRRWPSARTRCRAFAPVRASPSLP